MVYFKQIQTVVALLLVSLPLACGGKAKTNENGGGGASGGGGNNDKKQLELKTEEKKACDVFMFAVDLALRIHLKRKPEERGAMLAKGFKAYAQRVAENSSDPGGKAKMNAMAQAVGNSIDSCAPYAQLAANVTLEGKSKDSTFIRILRRTLSYTLSQMDRNSSYSYDDRLIDDNNQNGSIRGVGVQFKQRTDYMYERNPNYLVVDRIVYNVNQDKLKPGDKIYEIDGTPVRTQSFEKANAALNAVSSSSVNTIKVSVCLTPTSPDCIRTLSIVRIKPRATEVTWADEAAGIVQIKFLSFEAEKSVSQINNELRAFYDEYGSEKMKGLILDLRGNGGGRIAEAQELLENFLPLDSIVAHELGISLENMGAATEKKLERSVEMTTESFKSHRPLLVLVDRHTASASELVSAALMDYERILLVGEQTFGKGVMQSSLGQEEPLGGKLSVTSAYFYSPKGHSNQVKGLTPHILIEDPVYKLMTQKLKMRMGDFENIIAPTADLADVGQDLQPVTECRVTPDVIGQLRAEYQNLLTNGKEPSSCKNPSSADQIREEDDCLLDWARLIMKKMIALKI